MTAISRTRETFAPDSAVDWKRIGPARWYDCKLGTMADRRLSQLTGVPVHKIRYRRELFGIKTWSKHAMHPFIEQLGLTANSEVARLTGLSRSTVGRYARSLSVCSEALYPFRTLIGLIDDAQLAALAGIDEDQVTTVREQLDLPPALPQPIPKASIVENYQGPMLGFESILGSMSDARVSQATGVPIDTVESRRRFLKIPPYKRESKLTPYEHLLGHVPYSVLAKLTGLSSTRVRDFHLSRLG
jgi:transcriptional regulator with XRE-family HTH domain